ncbi:hypothetical protein CDAR_239021 [Caerostris darwini]|uniref:Uncharacterized protein n=1 Tax=Caerostris darwini TaxID=1538125 RepID=A0AAV4PR60_9ARAC|nr:hypothetical protein CDAR_239021 [Caerostris darwini]
MAECGDNSNTAAFTPAAPCRLRPRPLSSQGRDKWREDDERSLSHSLLPGQGVASGSEVMSFPHPYARGLVRQWADRWDIGSRGLGFSLSTPFWRGEIRQFGDDSLGS